MEPMVAVEIGRQALWITMIISGPMLIAGLLVGIVIGVFQAVTQIHEMTLSFIPKILVMVAVFIVTLPWMLIKMVDYTVTLFGQISTIVK
jgi:flagellar biosynthesis protein FliQ